MTVTAATAAKNPVNAHQDEGRNAMGTPGWWDEAARTASERNRPDGADPVTWWFPPAPHDEALFEPEFATHKGEQVEQAGCRARNGQVRPLALHFTPRWSRTSQNATSLCQR